MFSLRRGHQNFLPDSILHFYGSQKWLAGFRCSSAGFIWYAVRSSVSSGSVSLTRLSSYKLFIPSVEVHELTGIALDNRGGIEKSLVLLGRKPDVISVVVLEGRELSGALKDIEIEVLLTTLNADFRSFEGRQTLFVIPTTSPSLAQNISSKASGIGGMTSRDRPFFVFEGPKRSEYVEITNETLSAFNDQRTLLDYGISEELAKSIADSSVSIGQS